jgi:hypothetical protein
MSPEAITAMPAPATRAMTSHSGSAQTPIPAKNAWQKSPTSAVDPAVNAR